MGRKPYYSNDFKRNAVLYLGFLREFGHAEIVRIGNNGKVYTITVKNVRDLCLELGISSQSLYAWEKEGY